MQIGIAGLPGSGKTTTFNAIGRARVQVGTYTSPMSEPNLAVVKVPDPRVDALAAMFKPRSIKPAEAQFVDVAGLAKGAGAESAAAILGHLRTVDALLIVVNGFSSEATTDSIASDLATI